MFKINVIVCCIYKHPTLTINDFTNGFISSLLLKLQKESSKRILLLGDFNIDLLKYEISDSVNDFIDTLGSIFVLPLIFLPTRISKTSTLIDNIFQTQLLQRKLNQVMSHQHFQTIFHNLFFLPHFFSKIPVTKSNILRQV